MAPEWTDEALDQYARRVLLDALRAEWDDTEQDEIFVPSKKYQNEMREMVANPNAWCRKKTEPLWRRHARRAAAVAAIAAVVLAATLFQTDGGRTAARFTPVSTTGALLLTLAALGLVLAVILIGKKHK